MFWTGCLQTWWHSQSHVCQVCVMACPYCRDSLLKQDQNAHKTGGREQVGREAYFFVHTKNKNNHGDDIGSVRTELGEQWVSLEHMARKKKNRAAQIQVKISMH